MKKASSPLRGFYGKPDHSRTWLKKLVNRAEKDPSVLKRGSYEDSGELCAALCERVTHLALLESPAALPLALATVEIAEGVEDPHLRNRAREALIHASAAAGERDRALKVMSESASDAIHCCHLCRAAYFHRVADLCNRSGLLVDGFNSLGIALDQTNQELETRGWSEEFSDNWGRTLHVQAVNWMRLGMYPMALAFARVALIMISIDSPPALFLELLALVSQVLRGGCAKEDAWALECLESFRVRLKGTRMTDVLARVSHVEGLVRARLGGKRNFRIARERLEGAAVKLLRHGTPLDALAGVLDAAQFRCRPHPAAKDGEPSFPTASNLRTVKRWLEKCDRRVDLSEHREALADLVDALEDRPEMAFVAIGSFREKLGAPVAALLADRIGPPVEEEAAAAEAEEESADGPETVPPERASAVSWSLPASGFSGELRYTSVSGEELGVVSLEDE